MTATETRPVPAAIRSTPEEFAGERSILARRVVARVVDMVTVFFLTFALAVTVLGWAMADLTDRLDIAPWGTALAATLLFATVAFVYETVFVAKRGQTPGKDLLNLKVVGSDDGATPAVGRAIRRSLVFFVIRLVPGVATGTAAVFALAVPVPFDRRRRGVHDFIAGTAVIHYDADIEEGPVLSRPSGELEDVYGPRSWWRALQRRLR